MIYVSTKSCLMFFNQFVCCIGIAHVAKILHLPVARWARRCRRCPDIFLRWRATRLFMGNRRDLIPWFLHQPVDPYFSINENIELGYIYPILWRVFSWVIYVIQDLWCSFLVWRQQKETERCLPFSNGGMMFNPLPESWQGSNEFKWSKNAHVGM